MFESLWLTAYIAGVLLVALTVGVRVWVGLSRGARRRRLDVESRRRFDAVYTDTPLEDPKSKAQQRALESINAQFSVTRRTVIPLIAVLTLAALSVPFLDKVPAATVSFAIAATTLIGGVAARPFLENAIAGLVLSYSRSLSIGDTIKIDDLYGTIEDITTTHTTIKLWDWRRFVLPNSQTLKTSFINYSLTDLHVWASVEFYVSYDAKIDTVKEIATNAATRSLHYAEYEPPGFWVMGMEKDAVRCMLAAWADTPSDAWMLTHDIRASMMEEFRTAGIWSQVVNRIDARVVEQS